MLPWLPWMVVSYLLGSVSFAWWIARSRGVNLREHGSGNLGATNVGRVLGRKWGLRCFMLDVAKGAGPMFIAGAIQGTLGETALTPVDAYGWLLVAAAAIFGHMFPIFHGLRGGKGVATGLGALLGMFPLLTIPGLIAAVTWLLLASSLRYVGLASVVAAVLLPGYVALTATAWDVPVASRQALVGVVSLLALLVLVRHRSNLVRTWRGVEPRLGEGGKR